MSESSTNLYQSQVSDLEINGEINQNFKENHFDESFDMKNVSMLQKYSVMGFLLMNGLTPMAASARPLPPSIVEVIEKEATLPPDTAIINGFLGADEKPTGFIKALNGPKPNVPFVWDDFVNQVGTKAFKFANAPIPEG